MIFKTLTYYTDSFKLISNNRLYWFFLPPLFLIGVIIWVSTSFTSWLKNYLYQFIIDQITISDIWLLNTLNNTLSVILFILIKVFLFVLFAYWGGFIVLIFISPLLSMVSEKTEKLITGKSYPFSSVQFLKDLFRGIRLAARNMIMQTLLTLILFIVGFIPVIGLIAPILLFIVSAYYFGYVFFDYSLERKQFSISQSNAWISNHKWYVITHGSVFSLVLMIPFLGVFLASFISILSVMAATIHMNQLKIS